ncbi:hypothetical protein GCM10028805_62290 [Spirosoma harenae]
MRLFFSILLLASLGLSSCTDSTQQTQPAIYYDVLSFVKRQIADLSDQKPLVNKSVAINEKQNQQITHDINWERELELFTQADINKPALQGSYQIIRPDSLTYQYLLKDSTEHLIVRSLFVKLDSLTRQPRRIEASLYTSNPLYTSKRNLLLESGPKGEQWRVQHYKLSGYQKLPYFDKNEFLVEGKVQ